MTNTLLLQMRTEIDNILMESTPLYFVNYSPIVGVTEGKMMPIWDVSDDSLKSLYAAPKARARYILNSRIVDITQDYYDENIHLLMSWISREIKTGEPAPMLHWFFISELKYLVDECGLKSFSPLLMYPWDPEDTNKRKIVEMLVFDGEFHFFDPITEKNIPSFDMDYRTRCHFCVPLIG